MIDNKYRPGLSISTLGQHLGHRKASIGPDATRCDVLPHFPKSDERCIGEEIGFVLGQ
jgi:hypothetical protein